jgi:hypothetical protein
MTETRTERTGRPSLPATAAGRGLGCFPLRSPQSRAAARALVAARQKSEAGDDWDKPLDCTGIAETLDAARQRAERGEILERDWTPMRIPPDKENTVRGRLAARLNEARARVARFEAEREREQ